MSVLLSFPPQEEPLEARPQTGILTNDQVGGRVPVAPPCILLSRLGANEFFSSQLGIQAHGLQQVQFVQDLAGPQDDAGQRVVSHPDLEVRLQGDQRVQPVQ